MDMQPVIHELNEMHKKDRALKITGDYFVWFDRLSRAYGALDPSITPIDDLDQHAHVQNDVIFIGNWLEMVAYLYTEGIADKKILDDLGMIQVVRRFHAELKKRSCHVPFLETLLSAWTHLQNFELPQEMQEDDTSPDSNT